MEGNRISYWCLFLKHLTHTIVSKKAIKSWKHSLFQAYSGTCTWWKMMLRLWRTHRLFLASNSSEVWSYRLTTQSHRLWKTNSSPKYFCCLFYWLDLEGFSRYNQARQASFSKALHFWINILSLPPVSSPIKAFDCSSAILNSNPMASIFLYWQWHQLNQEPHNNRCWSTGLSLCLWVSWHFTSWLHTAL